MSAFLGPIHHWVFHKVAFQNEVTERLIEFARQKNLDIAPVLAKDYGELEREPLEKIINTSNIHGWLQDRVALVEYRLAAGVKMILDAGVATQEQAQELFYEIGKSHNAKALSSAQEAYKLLNDLLLDGMPCDRANELIAEHDDEVTWQQNICVHQPYWREVGEDISTYYALRGKLISGILDGTAFEFAVQGDAKYLIKRR